MDITEPGRLTIDELRQRIAVKPEAAFEALDLSRSSGYDAIKRGEIPSIRVGRRLLIPVVPLLRMLGADVAPTAAPTALHVQGHPSGRLR